LVALSLTQAISVVHSQRLDAKKEPAQAQVIIGEPQRPAPGGAGHVVLLPRYKAADG
jgi:hypothetical protein